MLSLGSILAGIIEPPPPSILARRLDHPDATQDEIRAAAEAFGSEYARRVVECWGLVEFERRTGEPF
jgi:hypothetical protein